VTSISDAYDSSKSRSPIGYDDSDRLTSIQGPWGNGTIGYVGPDNIDFQTLGSYHIDYHYDASNRVASITGSKAMTFGYDNRGNATGNGQSTFGFDNASQLTGVNCSPLCSVSYEYDGQGIRVSETKSGHTTYFVQAPNGDLQFEYTPFGKYWTKSIFLHGKRVSSETGSDAFATTTSATAAPALPQRGTAVTLTATLSPSAPGADEFRKVRRC
jgi:hypothetical protein